MDARQAATFPAFAQQASQQGFAFLYQRVKAGHDDGPILVTVKDDRIVGALGPLAILADRNGVRLQPRQYFAVDRGHRGRGQDRALWRASMAWDRAKGAEYQVLQASSGSLAEQLYPLRRTPYPRLHLRSLTPTLSCSRRDSATAADSGRSR